jgi:hypothetical protein
VDVLDLKVGRVILSLKQCFLAQTVGVAGSVLDFLKREFRLANFIANDSFSIHG